MIVTRILPQIILDYSNALKIFLKNKISVIPSSFIRHRMPLTSRLLVLTLLGVCGGLRLRAPLTRGPEPEPLWFTQTLDHFNVRDQR